MKLTKSTTKGEPKKGESKERHPELHRREFMEGTWKLLNVGAFTILGGFLGSLPVLSMSSGHPDAMTCYECRACAAKCPWHFDPAIYVVAGRTNNPNKRMLAQIPVEKYNRIVCGLKKSGNARDPDRLITLENLNNRDKYIKVRVEGRDDPITVGAALDAGYISDDLVEVYEMRAKDAAYYDPICGTCDTMCPVDISVTKYIRDLRPDGVFK